MTASRTARQKRAAEQAGPLALVKVEVGQRTGDLFYKILCTECKDAPLHIRSTYRSGHDNGFIAAMDRWVFHLSKVHPGEQAPCLDFLPSAIELMRERKRAERDLLRGIFAP